MPYVNLWVKEKVMAIGIDGVKTEYQEEIDKKINNLTAVKDALQKEVDKLTEDVLSGTAKAEIFKSELQSIVDYMQTMIDTCNIARNNLVDKGQVWVKNFCMMLREWKR